MKQNLDILTLGLPEAWNMYKIMGIHDNTYNRARFGVRIRFDINDYLKGRVLTKSKSGIAIIKGCSVNLEEFETELEEREKLIKIWLTENTTDEPLVRPRGDI